MKFLFIDIILQLCAPRSVVNVGGGGGGGGSERGGDGGSDGDGSSIHDSNTCDMRNESPYGDDFDAAAEQQKEKEDELVKKMCLPLAEFIHLLQGEGVRDTKSKEHLLKYPDVTKLAEKFYKLWNTQLKVS
jgi:hypothetical protein